MECISSSALMVARAERDRRASQLAATADEHLDNPSAASRDQLRKAVAEFRLVESLNPEQILTQVQADERRRVIRQENTAHGAPRLT